MGFRFQYFVIDASEPVLWVAIAATSVVAIVVGQAIGHRAAAKGGRRGIALASVALVVVAAVLIAGEVTLLYVLFAVQTGVRHASLWCGICFSSLVALPHSPRPWLGVQTGT